MGVSLSENSTPIPVQAALDAETQLSGAPSAYWVAAVGSLFISRALPTNYWGYNKSMNLEFDQVKRKKTLLERGLDFARAAEVFDGIHYTGQDKRVDYEEDRFITVGWLDANMTVMVWTPRGEVRRIISMRKANDREKTLYASYLE